MTSACQMPKLAIFLSFFLKKDVGTIRFFSLSLILKKIWCRYFNTRWKADVCYRNKYVGRKNSIGIAILIGTEFIRLLSWLVFIVQQHENIIGMVLKWKEEDFRLYGILASTWNSTMHTCTPPHYSYVVQCQIDSALLEAERFFMNLVWTEWLGR